MKIRKQVTISHQDAAEILIGTRNILYLNEAISWLITDLLQEIKTSNLYKQKVKMLCRRVSEQMRMANLKICDVLKQSLEVMQDESDEFQKLIEPSQQILFYSTKNSLLKAPPNHTEYITIMTYISLISKTIDISRQNMYDWFQYYDKMKAPVDRYQFIYMDNTNTLNAFRKLYEEILRLIGIPEDSTMEGENMIDAHKIYRQRLEDIDNTIKAIKAAGHSTFNFDGAVVERPEHCELPEKCR